jgi:hypothetical protein
MVSCGIWGSVFYVGSSCPAKAAWMERGEAINLQSVSAKFTNSAEHLLGSIKLAAIKRGAKARADHPLKEITAVQALSYGFYTAESTWNKCRLIIESLDKCFVGSWVFAQSATGLVSAVHFLDTCNCFIALPIRLLQYQDIFLTF